MRRLDLIFALAALGLAGCQEADAPAPPAAPAGEWRSALSESPWSFHAPTTVGLQSSCTSSGEVANGKIRIRVGRGR